MTTAGNRLPPDGAEGVAPIERLAEAAHEVFVRAMRAAGHVYGPVTDPVARTHSALRPYAALSEDEKEQNRSTVRDIPAKLAAAGYQLVPQPGDRVPFAFPADELEELSRLEHIRWVRSKVGAGWRYADQTDKPRKLHRSLVPWRRSAPAELAHDYTATEIAALGPGELSEDEREKDRVMVRGIPEILAQAGLTLVGASP